MIQPEVPRAAPPVITTAPVIVVPPPNPDQAMPQTPADILKAIGEALSCGAENFENLTQAERARCKREPWIARKLPNGTIVLEAANSVALRAAAHAQAVRRRRHAPSDADRAALPDHAECPLPSEHADGHGGHSHQLDAERWTDVRGTGIVRS